MAHSSKKRCTIHKEPGNTKANEQPSVTLEVTPKKALAEAIRHLGADATHAELAQFAKERFGLNLHFVMVIPKSTVKTARPGGRANRSQARRKAG
jgi:hypothetical protein